MWKKLKEQIQGDLEFHKSGIMQSMSESVVGEAKCEEILKYMEKIEEDEK